MYVAIPKEINSLEPRVAATPGSVKQIIKLNNTKANTILITDTNGRTIWKGITDETLTIPNELANGMYFIQINNNTTNKIIIQND